MRKGGQVTMENREMQVGDVLKCEDGRKLVIKKNEGVNKDNYPYSLADKNTGEELTSLSYLTSYRDMYYHFGIDWSKVSKDIQNDG